VDDILSPVEPDQSPDIREKVYHKLRAALLSGELGPGERLVERKLAAKLGVSRTPVREAIRMLELEGLARHVPGVGSVKAELNAGVVLEIYSIRAVLEGLAARLAAERIGEGNLARLAEICTVMEACIDGNDVAELEELHREFHDLVYRCAESPRLAQMISSVVGHVAGFTRRGYAEPGRLEQAASEHRQLARAIGLREGMLAERIVREHVENSRRAFFEQYFRDLDANRHRT